MVRKCCVFQPFDEGPFDKRYDEILAPAIEAANLQPYRVDRDPNAVVLMEKLHEEIRSTSACLADISIDNPNVWYELGFAIASNKPVVIICSRERKTFPFDIQHRRIIRYSLHSASDFRELKTAVTETLDAQVKKAELLQRIATVPPSFKDTAGLNRFEMATLALVRANRRINNWTSKLHEDMEKSGFTPLAMNLAIDSLKRKGFLTIGKSVDEDSGEESEAAFMTTRGEDWLLENQDKIDFELIRR
jgi:nucleoside 2-deoxyribosyltransferase